MVNKFLSKGIHPAQEINTEMEFIIDISFIWFEKEGGNK